MAQSRLRRRGRRRRCAQAVLFPRVGAVGVAYLCCVSSARLPSHALMDTSWQGCCLLLPRQMRQQTGCGSLDAPRSATKCIQQTVLYAETAPERGGARARQAPASNRPAVLPDGSYASQTALADTFAGAAAHGAAAAPNLRTLLLAGDFFLGAVVAGAPDPPACLLKLSAPALHPAPAVPAGSGLFSGGLSGVMFMRSTPSHFWKCQCDSACSRPLFVRHCGPASSAHAHVQLIKQEAQRGRHAGCAGALTKLLLRMRELPGVGTAAANRATAEGMLAIAAMLLLGESAALAHPADADSVDRMITCLQARPTGLLSCLAAVQA